MGTEPLFEIQPTPQECFVAGHLLAVLSERTAGHEHTTCPRCGAVWTFDPGEDRPHS